MRGAFFVVHGDFSAWNTLQVEELAMTIAIDLAGYLSAAKTTLDLFKGLKDLIPKGAAADKAQKQIEEAEKALQTSEAELAKALGFRLCRCTFPPQIMLWNKAERANFCPACGDRYPPKQKPNPNPGGFRQGGGPQSWMGN